VLHNGSGPPTCCLPKGLQGAADTDHDGWVTVRELYNYARPKVLDESQRLGYDQTPQLLPEAAGSRANFRLSHAR
jgi:hypothetical protein